MLIKVFKEIEDSTQLELVEIFDNVDDLKEFVYHELELLERKMRKDGLLCNGDREEHENKDGNCKITGTHCDMYCEKEYLFKKPIYNIEFGKQLVVFMDTLNYTVTIDDVLLQAVEHI